MLKAKEEELKKREETITEQEKRISTQKDEVESLKKTVDDTQGNIEKYVVTTTTTQTPVYVTTIKTGTVTYQTARSIQIKDPDGRIHKFTQSEMTARYPQYASNRLSPFPN
jgi:predicted RNase H-like nuclease (RuvC/YqgF family)